MYDSYFGKLKDVLAKSIFSKDTVDGSLSPYSEQFWIDDNGDNWVDDDENLWTGD